MRVFQYHIVLMVALKQKKMDILLSTLILLYPTSIYKILIISVLNSIFQNH